MVQMQEDSTVQGKSTAGTINDLPIKPIAWNIGTLCIICLGKYLAHSLSLLSQSEFNVRSTKHFMSNVK